MKSQEQIRKPEIDYELLPSKITTDGHGKYMLHFESPYSEFHYINDKIHAGGIVYFITKLFSDRMKMEITGLYINSPSPESPIYNTGFNYLRE